MPITQSRTNPNDPPSTITELFLSHLWKPGEVGFVGRRDPKAPPMPDGSRPIPATPVASPQEATSWLTRNSATYNVYFAPAVFKERTYRSEEDGKIRGARITSNMIGARALWVDIDAGPGKPYATREKALAALDAAVQVLGGGTWRAVGPNEVFPPDQQFRMNVATGQSEVFVPAAAFPSPTVIGSGNGVHAYWFVDELIPKDRWKVLALSHKDALESAGLHFDKQCTVNNACWLRPIGTLNHKTTPPRPVEVVRPNPTIPLQMIEDALRPFVEAKQAQGVNRPVAAPAHTPPGNFESELAELSEIGALGTVDKEPHWFRVLAGIKRSCKGDREKAIELADALSRNADKYEGRDAVEGKLKREEKEDDGDGPTIDLARTWARTDAINIISRAFDGRPDNGPDLGPIPDAFKGKPVDVSNFLGGIEIAGPGRSADNLHLRTDPASVRRATAYLARWWPPKWIDELRARYQLDEGLIEQCKALYTERTRIEGVSGIAADWGAARTALLVRAKALQPDASEAVNTLIHDTIASGIPSYTFKPIIDAMAKAAGLDATELKQQMKKARAAFDSRNDPSPGDDEDSIDYEPAKEPIPLKTIADRVRQKFGEWIDAPAEHLDIMVLWGLGTWGLLPGCSARQLRKRGGVFFYPYLWLSSVDTDSGKSTALRSLQAVARRPMSIGRITPAALFRDLAALQRCGLIDEIDDLLALYREIASLLETACYRDSEVKLTEPVTRNGREQRIVVRFRLFGPLAVGSIDRGGIEARRNTLRSRSIRLRMVPSKREDMLSLENHVRAVGDMAEDIGPHLSAHADAIREAMEGGPSTPPPTRNRRRDVWRHFFAIAELLSGDWPERCLAVCKLIEQGGKSPAVSDARDCLDAMQACQAERGENYAEAMHAAADAAVALARKHLPALSDPALVAVGKAAIVTVALPGRPIVQDARAEAVAAGVPANILDDCTAAGIEAAKADGRGVFTHTSATIGRPGFGTNRAGYDPGIPVDFLPTLNFLDWLMTNGGAQFACATATQGGRPITAHRLARLLTDAVKGDYLRQRQNGGRRIQVSGWSVAELEKVWAEEERAAEIP